MHKDSIEIIEIDGVMTQVLPVSVLEERFFWQSGINGENPWESDEFGELNKLINNLAWEDFKTNNGDYVPGQEGYKAKFTSPFAASVSHQKKFQMWINSDEDFPNKEKWKKELYKDKNIQKLSKKLS